MDDGGVRYVQWKDIQAQEINTINSFEVIMLQVRDIRRKIVENILHDDNWKLNKSCLVSLENALSSLEGGTKGFKKELRTSSDEKSPRVVFNIRDEMNGIKKDIVFLKSCLKGDERMEEEELAVYHPLDKGAFMTELNGLELLLASLSGIHFLITDWDGTMKNYGSNYATCMQPAYSAVILARFAFRCTTHSAVLTAGPLRDPGILDLTCVPPDGNWLTFGGSWGREWLLDGERVVDESSFTDASRKALDRLAAKLRTALSDVHSPFYHFQFVGSGFQRKVDRVTLGIQNVSGDITPEGQQRYLEMVRGLVEEVDRHNEHFLIRQERLDVEICLKATWNKRAWDKAKGLELLLKHLKADISDGNCLICGDTMSDLPMVEFARAANPNTFAVFVNPSGEVRERLGELLAPDKYCLVSCPEVLHVAFAKMLLRPVLVY